MMNVPNVVEWQMEPGFRETPCCCVRVCGKAWHDCIACNGSGVVGLVPIGGWEEARKKQVMPEHKGDPRFDPRVSVAPYCIDDRR